MQELDAIARLDATAQAALVAKKEVTAVELVDACARRVAALDPLLHTIVTTDFDRARARAKGPLAGPFAGGEEESHHAAARRTRTAPTMTRGRRIGAGA